MPLENEEPLEAPTTITIPDADPPPSNDNDEPAAPDGPPTRRHTHADRKANKDARFQEAIKAAEEARVQARAETEARQRLEAQVNEMRARQVAFEHQQRASADPGKQKINEAHANAWKKLQHAAAADPARSEEAMREYHEALTTAAEVAADRRMEAQLERFRQSQPDPQVMRQRNSLASEFEWLETNAAARAMADGYVGYLTAQKGRPWTLATYREACAMAAKEFGLGGAVDKPSAASRAAYGGVPGTTGAGADDDGKMQIQASGEDAGKMRKLAKARYPELEPDDAWRKWLKNEGSRLGRK